MRAYQKETGVLIVNALDCFLNARGIAVGCSSASSNEIFVTDYTDVAPHYAYVAVLNWKTQTIVRTVGQYSNTAFNGCLKQPSHLLIDCGAQELFVADPALNSTQAFNLFSGAFKRRISDVAGPRSLALDSANHRLYVGAGAGIFVYDSAAFTLLHSFSIDSQQQVCSLVLRSNSAWLYAVMYSVVEDRSK